jgi:hypothetical protein
MIIAFYMLVAVALIGFAVAFGLRRVVFDLDETSKRLHQPDARTVSYLVPEGQDPAVLTAALHHEGYASATEEHGGHTHVLVECTEDGDRANIRSVIEHVHTTSFDGVPINVGHIRFDDES